MKYRLLIAVFWLATTAWLVRFEAFPERFSATSTGYTGLLSRDVLVLDSWMRVLFKDKPIGYSHTRVDVNESSPREHYLVENKVHLRLQLMGQAQEVYVETDVYLDTAQRLQRFAFLLSSRGYNVEVKGTRRSIDTYDIAIKTAGTRSRTTLRIPDDVVIYSPMTEMAMRNLKPGEHMVMRVLDPASLSTANITIRADRKETVSYRGQPRETTVLTMDYLGMNMQSWVDGQGNVIRETTPFGWNMEQCTPDEAFAAIREAGATPDLLAGMSVPCRGAIPDSWNCRVLRLRLSGVPFADSDLRTERQTPILVATNEVDLTVNAAEFREEAGSLTPDDAQKNLRPTPWVQSDNPELVKQAAAIVGARTQALQKATAICDWVYKNVAKEMTVSLPSAIDVLHTMAGDCNEHTYLFVGLARAAGIPARIHVGLAYHERAFYYHAWPAVYVGHWMEMDPTWGQHAVDATHIALVEGELANQIQIARVVGQLAIEVVSRDYGAARGSAVPAAGTPASGAPRGEDRNDVNKGTQGETHQQTAGRT